jgi:hypothetical protein
LDKQLSENTKLTMSIAKDIKIYVYTLNKSTLLNTFTSAKKAVEHFQVYYNLIFTTYYK